MHRYLGGSILRCYDLRSCSSLLLMRAIVSSLAKETMRHLRSTQRSQKPDSSPKMSLRPFVSSEAGFRVIPIPSCFLVWRSLPARSGRAFRSLRGSQPAFASKEAIRRSIRSWAMANVKKARCGKRLISPQPKRLRKSCRDRRFQWIADRWLPLRCVLRWRAR